MRKLKEGGYEGWKESKRGVRTEEGVEEGRRREEGEGGKEGMGKLDDVSKEEQSHQKHFTKKNQSREGDCSKMIDD